MVYLVKHVVEIREYFGLYYDMPCVLLKPEKLKTIYENSEYLNTHVKTLL